MGFADCIMWTPLTIKSLQNHLRVEEIQSLFETEFGRAKMHCQIEMIHEAGGWAILEWTDSLGLSGCGFFQVKAGKNAFQRGYFDQLLFFRAQDLGVPDEFLKV